MHIVIWGLLGEAFPFFKPNFTKMEQYGRDMGAEEVRFMRHSLQALTASLQQALVVSHQAYGLQLSAVHARLQGF